MLPFLPEFPVMLAPIAGASDKTYRALCKELGCDFAYTEMVSAKGLYYGGAESRALLDTDPSEGRCGVQLFGREPELMADMAARIAEEYPGRFALIDLNMGCPARKITGNGEGSALMLNLPLAGKIIEAVAKASPLPVTVKFRKGFDAEHCCAAEFARMAEEHGAAMLCVHGRTREQMYGGKADWAAIAAVKQAVSIPVIGNGDVFCGADAARMKNETGCDGIMAARGALGNPFLFAEIKAALAGLPYTPPTDRQRIDTAILHARRMAAAKGERAHIEMRKHVAWYLKGIRGAAPVRAATNLAPDMAALIRLLQQFQATLAPN